MVVGTTHIPALALNAPIPVDPGDVQIRLTGPAVCDQTVQQHVGEGERPTLLLTVEPYRVSARRRAPVRAAPCRHGRWPCPRRAPGLV